MDERDVAGRGASGRDFMDEEERERQRIAAASRGELYEAGVPQRPLAPVPPGGVGPSGAAAGAGGVLASAAARAGVGTDQTRAMTETTPMHVTRMDEGQRVIELREEELVPHKELREVGEVEIRTVVERFPSRLEVEAYREEVQVEHVPVGQVVSERVKPWEEGDVLVVPVYEEQLVVVKRLMLREHLRVRRLGTTETRLFEDNLLRERLVIGDLSGSGLVHETFPTAQEAERGGIVVAEDDHTGDTSTKATAAEEHEDGGLIDRLVRKVIS